MRVDSSLQDCKISLSIDGQVRVVGRLAALGDACAPFSSQVRAQRPQILPIARDAQAGAQEDVPVVARDQNPLAAPRAFASFQDWRGR